MIETDSHRESRTAYNLEILREVDGMTLDQIEAVLPVVEAQAGDIQAQLESAKVTSQAGGSIDSTWFAKANHALRLKRVRIEALHKRRKQLKRQHLTKKGHVSLERAFMTVAKRLLVEETYQMLLAEAKDLLEDVSSEKPIK
jgi:hypothetical protein